MSKRLAAVALASRSPRRKHLLESVGLAVEIVPSSYEETMVAGLGPAQTALRHALGKAGSAAPTGPSMLVAADTVVSLDGVLLGKPRDCEHARSMLRQLAGRVHQVFTGYVVVDRSTRRAVSGVETATVHFLPLSEETIAAYVASGDPMDKAGGYGILGLGGLLVASISGDFYTVVGLPLARIGTSVQELGYNILAV
jgi:septum formation protein